jgi:hypothetical protein
MAGKLELFKEWVSSAQTKPIYVVVVHDWRDEDTELELSNFLATLVDQKYKYISGKFGSPGLARNQAREFIQTKWVTFWDSDDFPNLDAILSAIYESEINDDILIGSFETKDFNNGATRTQALLSEWKMSVALNPGLWRMIFKRDILEGLEFSDLLMGEDQLFMAKLDIFSRRVRVFQEIFYTYQIMFTQQATQSRSSQKDLTRCLLQFKQAIPEIADLNKGYYQIMYVKQIISSVKYLSLGDKLFALSKLALFAKENGAITTFRYLVRIRRGR